MSGAATEKPDGVKREKLRLEDQAGWKDYFFQGASLEEKKETEKSDESAAEPKDGGGAGDPSGGPTDGDTSEVNESGAENKAEGVEEGLGGARHFFSVGMTMKEGEESNADHGKEDRDFLVGGNGESESQHGNGDPDFHGKEGNCNHAEDSAYEHKAQEGGGDCPSGAPAHLCAEHADAEHGEKVIQS